MEEPRHPDAHRELGLFFRVELARALRGRSPRPAFSRATTSRTGRRRRRTCDGASQPACAGPSPLRRNSRAGFEVDGVKRGHGLRDEELLQAVAIEFRLVLRAALAGFQVAVFEIQAVAGVRPAQERLPGPVGRFGVGGEVFLDGLAHDVVELRLGLMLGVLFGGFEVDALEVAGGQARRRGVGRPNRRSWPRRSRRRGTAGSRRRPGSSTISRIASLGG